MELQINSEFGRKSQSAMVLLRHLLEKPVVDVNQVKNVTGLSYNAANTLVATFIQAGFLKEVTGHNRNRVFILYEYLNEFQTP